MHLRIRLTEEEKKLPPAELAKRVVSAVLSATVQKAEVHVHQDPKDDGELRSLSDLVDAVETAYISRMDRMLQDIAKEVTK